MTSLSTADGRILRAQRPVGAGGSFLPSSFPPMWSDGTRYGSDDGYLKSFEGIYRSQPVIAAVVNKLARRIAALPLDALRKNPDGSREKVTGDSLDTLVRRPMPRWSTVHWVNSVAMSLLVHGNAVCAKVRSDKDLPPDMLWPLDWSQLSAYGETGGTIEWWGTTQFEAGVERVISAQDTVHFAWSAPSGSEIGISPLEHLGVTVRIEDAAQREQTSMFKNGIRPSAAVSMDTQNGSYPNAKQLEQASQVVKQAHGGMDRSGSWVWLGANAKIQPLSFSPVDAALVDQRKLSREEVGMVYDLAGPLMNDLTHGTYSNVEELNKGLYRDVLPPWTTLIVETLQAQLLDQEPAWMDRILRFDFSDKLRGDPLTMAQVDKSDVEAGIRTRDEAREGRGLAAKGGPAAELTANTNNQAPVNGMGATSESASPAVDGR